LIVIPRDLEISPTPTAPALRSASSGPARSDVVEVDAGHHPETILVTTGADDRELLPKPFSGHVAGDDEHAQVQRIHFLDELIDRLCGRHDVTVNVDHRELRPGHRMLFHHDGGRRPVIDDRRRRKFWCLADPNPNERRARRAFLASLNGNATAAAGRQCRIAGRTLPATSGGCGRLRRGQGGREHGGQEHESSASHAVTPPVRQPYCKDCG
jgi:hypothetical protein